MTLAPPVEDVLRRGALCYVAAPGPDGPHLTPVVFALDGGRLWITTARGSRKARLWRSFGAASGMVVSGRRAVTFRGEVTTYDALDPSTWQRALTHSPLVARASVRFTLKNLRFFAGYALDAHRVPLAWTPPGRVFLSMGLTSGALLDLDDQRPELTWGWPEGAVAGQRSFRPRREGPSVDRDAPSDLRERLARSGRGVLAVGGVDPPVVLPVRWVRQDDEGAYYCVLSRELLALAGARSEFPASLVADRASRWRAAHMEGVQFRGPAEVFLPDDLRSGREALLDRAGPAGELPPDPAVVRIRPRRAVWWRGWSSGTVGRP